MLDCMICMSRHICITDSKSIRVKSHSSFKFAWTLKFWLLCVQLRFIFQLTIRSSVIILSSICFNPSKIIEVSSAGWSLCFHLVDGISANGLNHPTLWVLCTVEFRCATWQSQLLCFRAHFSLRSAHNSIIMNILW